METETKNAITKISINDNNNETIEEMRKKMNNDESRRSHAKETP